MYDAAAADQGWSDYTDERLGSGMGAISGYDMQGLAYTPDLGAVGTKETYWPRDVGADTDALAYLGFLADGSAVLQSYGDQRADMANEAGAWDPTFRAAVSAFQKVAAPFGYTGVVDGWIGPKTRAALANAVNVKNAATSPVTPPFVPPATPPAPGVPQFIPPSAPSLPAVVPGGPPVAPASTAKKDNTTTYVALGIGGVLLAGVAAWALLD